MMYNLFPFAVAPRVNISPQRITTRAGETIQLRCDATGGGQWETEWSKVEGQMNPRATEGGGILEIRQVTAADAGRYRCTLRTPSGQTQEGYAIVEVEGMCLQSSVMLIFGHPMI